MNFANQQENTAPVRRFTSRIISFLLVFSMLFNGGLAGVIMLWAWAGYKWYKSEKERAENMAKYNKVKREFKEKNGYDYPGYF